MKQKEKYLYLTVFLLLCCLCLGVKAQTEIPAGNREGKIIKQGTVSYAVNSEYKVEWSAIKITTADIESNVFIPNDSELFRELAIKDYPLWPLLEKQVQLWALEFDSVFVVTGKVPLAKVEENAAGAGFYKVILKGCKGDAIGFLMPPGRTGTSLLDFAVPVDSVETLTGLDFFPGLDKALQQIIEPAFDIQFWPLSIE